MGPTVKTSAEPADPQTASAASQRPTGRDRVALIPQRSNGRERVAMILKAAAAVIQDRGYEAATMKEIAERSDTKIGSLYRFFPTKELLADALIQLYADSSQEEWESIVDRAPHITTEQLAELLLNAYIQARKTHAFLPTLLESGPAGSVRRKELRARNLEKVSEALRAHAPHLKRAAARSIAVIMIYNMRAMMALTFDPSAPNAPGALAELRKAARIYLRERLKPDA
jgi:AcrR family transcriptional regulator